MHFVCVIECNDGSLCTGCTTDMERRIMKHDASEGTKYTRDRTPIELVHVEEFDSKSATMPREYEVKQLHRREKQRLAES